MKLFIANCSKQVQDFHYRLPEKGIRMQRIEIGQQVQITGDLGQQDVDALLAQHERYGLKSADDARKVRGGFTGLVYSIDKPVKRDDMVIVLQKNDEDLTAKGQQQRKEAAIATSAAISQNPELGLNALETSITEVKKDGSEPDVQEGVRVDKNAGEDEQRVTGNAAKNKLNNKR